MNKYISVSGNELRHIADLTLTFDDFEIEEEEALEDEIYEKLRDFIINPDFDKNDE